ncbi:c-type cytochrome [Mycetohabitans sp. B5]|uniref:Cytochrome c n=1 Tax=Mycetohabitans endofungorum TaxID=417203 RepID=A0A2P5KE75_9BURK|nr:MULTISPECIES: c-type cytochrome [Mycetohabitans]MCG1053824.1 c-type cytochrome [Mycetohabitans sp. B5]PPB84989.1 cytochrome c [Mycetohabitans endofungorum]
MVKVLLGIPRIGPPPALLRVALAVSCIARAHAADNVPSDATRALAEQHNCMACHCVTHRMLAPSFRQIAAHYAHQPDASVRLQRKIIDGGAGTWGNAPMPANTQITDAQAAALAAWILQLR